MTITQVLEALKPGPHETYPVASEAEVRKTEAILRCPLPPSFRRFVKSFSNGAYLYMIQEVSAVGDGNPSIAPIQETRWFTGKSSDRVHFREGGCTLLKYLIPYGLDDNGNAWCFVTEIAGGRSGEYPVAYLDPSTPRLYGRLSGFVAWLSILVETRTEVIRTLYGDDVLLGELCLG